MGIPEGEERENGALTIPEEIMAENFSNLMKDTNTNIQEAKKSKYDGLRDLQHDIL